MSSSKHPGKKDKGKAVQRPEDYQLQVPTKNQFLTSPNFPPLPYKTAVTNPAPSSNTNDAYIVRHVEHLLLTSCKTLPPTNVIPSIIQKNFGSSHFATDDLRRIQQFYELILVDTKSAIITHTPNKFNPGKSFTQNALSSMSSILNNGKTHLRSTNSPSHLSLKHSITMITKMPGIERFSFSQTFIPGSSIFMIHAQIHFLYGFTIGGYGSGAPQLYFLPKPMKDGTSGPRRLLQWSLI